MDYCVYAGKQAVGKVQVLRQGLYYRIICRCNITGSAVNRLWVSCGGKQENLGVLVPVGDGFGLDRKFPVKRLGEGEMTFSLGQKQEDRPEGTFVPIYPEEPFSYIERLKDAYLVKKNGQIGVVLRD